MNGIGAIVEKLRRATVSVGAGSGVVWRDDGVIVTNAHVVRGRRVPVELWDGRRFEVAVEKSWPARDLAVLRIPTNHLDSVQPRELGTLRTGEWAVAVGNPFGFQGAVSTGLVQGVQALGNQRWVTASVRLAPGNSGGPLADAQGRLLGINTLISGGLGFAAPADEIARYLTRGAPPRLGVTVRPVTQGLLILEVEPDSAAARASLLPGDTLVEVAGRTLRTPWDLAQALETAEWNPLELVFRRGAEPHARRVTRARAA